MQSSSRLNGNRGWVWECPDLVPLPGGVGSVVGEDDEQITLIDTQGIFRIMQKTSNSIKKRPFIMPASISLIISSLINAFTSHIYP